MKRLNELFDIDNDMKIYSIHSDSRYVKPYSIFFCIEGLSVDGHRYVDDAIFQGAKVIVHSKDIEKQPGIIYIKVADALDELNRVSNVFYDYPSKKMRVVGVTGTSGKTVVASMVKSVMDHYCKAAYMGTISLEYDGVEEQCPYTTPETLYVQKKLFDMARRGVKVVAMEASSHGLALKRIDAVDFNIAVLTNISDEHLDFHGTRRQYIESKKKLFSMLSTNSIAVLNKDEEVFAEFKAASAVSQPDSGSIPRSVFGAEPSAERFANHRRGLAGTPKAERTATGRAGNQRYERSWARSRNSLSLSHRVLRRSASAYCDCPRINS